MESKTTTESSDRRFALLIDADNAPRSALGDVMAEVAVYDWALTAADAVAHYAAAKRE